VSIPEARALGRVAAGDAQHELGDAVDDVAVRALHDRGAVGMPLTLRDQPEPLGPLAHEVEVGGGPSVQAPAEALVAAALVRGEQTLLAQLVLALHRRGEQAVLRAVAGVQGRLGYAGPRGDGVHPRSLEAVRGEGRARGVEDEVLGDLVARCRCFQLDPNFTRE
jgi:hypothetical protein